MSDIARTRAERRELADRLMAEYADAVPPGQVLAAVARAHCLARSTRRRLGKDKAASSCEGLARRTLAERIAGLPGPVVGS